MQDVRAGVQKGKICGQPVFLSLTKEKKMIKSKSKPLYDEWCNKYTQCYCQMVSMEYNDNLLSAYSIFPQPIHRLSYIEHSKMNVLKEKKSKYEHRPKGKDENNAGFYILCCFTLGPK